MLPGYNTNGFSHHRIEDALDILADLGYRSVALTLDHHALDPFDPGLSTQLDQVRDQLERHQMRCVVETGARFLLDRWRKHHPTLLDPAAGARQVRLDFLCRAVELAAELHADAVSFWSGAAPSSESPGVLMPRLVEGCRRLCGHAERHGVRLAFEPEPGMFVDTLPRFADLFAQVRHPLFGLTLDVGHLHCMNELAVADNVLPWRHVLWNVHIADMRTSVHDHLMFGEGDIDFPPVVQALRQAGYAGGLHVELSRHSHDAVATARRARAFLRGLTG
jgi:sugar phosphate isomerase/epimerase